MANDIVLNNYSDDSKIKEYISSVLMPRVFHDIPLNNLNTGFFSIVNEYMSQAIENMAFTSSFYLNESFITKAMLSDSIYAEAAIFNIGYSFATASCCNMMLELKIDDLQKNATYNPNTGLYEFILDKNTKFNLKNGNVYSLDYDILIQYQKVETSVISKTIVPAWNVQYTNMDQQNSIAVNKNPYILYRVSDTWLCMFVKVSEYERETHVFVNNMTNGIPNADQIITCKNHIAGFDVKYIDGNGNEQYLDRDHILPIHSDVKDQQPYVHYIMDDPHTIRFMFQLNGIRYFVPDLNSSFEIIVYSCHGEAANFTAFKPDEQPSVITASNRFSNNGNVVKAAFVISGSQAGTNIGTIETTRRETIEAYNTANVLSSDHDIEEWFKTFFFKNILYPFFFKRRDDPWGRIWSGFLALKDVDNTVFRTNTLHASIPYDVLYNNNDNIISDNEIIIPPGWLWQYKNTDVNRYTVAPVVKSGGNQVETARSSLNADGEFTFANPFGIRIQKSPFAIGYFNPWVNQFATASIVPSKTIYTTESVADNNDVSLLYHATPTVVNLKRTYMDDYYTLSAIISPTTVSELDGSSFVRNFRNNTTPPTFPDVMWNYFLQPTDIYARKIPLLIQNADDQYIIFNPSETYFCVRTRNQISDTTWALSDYWIEDGTSGTKQLISLPLTGFSGMYGSDEIWGSDGLWRGYEVYVSGDTDITMYPAIQTDDWITFDKIESQNYYEMRLSSETVTGKIQTITTTGGVLTGLTKYGETQLYRIGHPYSTVYINIRYDDGIEKQFQIMNAANVYIPYPPSLTNLDGTVVFELDEVMPNGMILYAEMKPTASNAAVEYYRIPLSLIDKNVSIAYLENTQLKIEENDLRVILEAKMNGTTTGRLEMTPVVAETDGSIRFDAVMYPLNKLVDVDNRIQIASLDYGGGSWIPTTSGGVVSIDATNPEFTVSILFRSEDTVRPSEIENDTDGEYIGYRLTDVWNLNDISLMQELKEMRSVVVFDEYGEPTESQLAAYDSLIALIKHDDSVMNLYTIEQYAYHVLNGTSSTYQVSFDDAKYAASVMYNELNTIIIRYASDTDVPTLSTDYMEQLIDVLNGLMGSTYQTDNDWSTIWELTSTYASEIDTIFKDTTVNSDVTIQLVPFVQDELMRSDHFETFVAAFTQVHAAIEPVIFNRLEGNNYLDCKLIATYGLPHSYCADLDQSLDPPKFWPDLNVQIEFDVKLTNPGLATNTLNELRTIIKSYFGRLTTIHTPVDMVSMDNNIYISQLIRLLEDHPNVAYLKYRGFYTDEKDQTNGKYMNAEYQGIVQIWKTLDEMPMDELERYVPEMFTLNDADIVLNLI